ncbi:hypothetical protein E6C27_scaffold352G00010 [Cucumis melo var. makuwa]|uniref:Uncharacterized protein n=2 Tax=Cucumis melo var. makuwa TaxID=1194695 RepID=A0A5A7VPT4_CUCMM|nr:hypothetical protein E6C27_scaffold352G00010 [Cucumis melo var. makuwa]
MELRRATLIETQRRTNACEKLEGRRRKESATKNGERPRASRTCVAAVPSRAAPVCAASRADLQPPSRAGPCSLGSTPSLTFRTRQPNLQHVVVTTRTVMAVRRVSRWRVVVPAWVSFGITTYLGLCGPTEHQSSMDIDMTRVTRRGPRIPIVLGVPRGTEDQSYVPTGAHVARVRERARDWVEDEARAKASWRATRSDRGEP